VPPGYYFGLASILDGSGLPLGFDPGYADANLLFGATYLLQLRHNFLAQL
jgi:hypothetical protein